jgi:hypothetical protein
MQRGKGRPLVNSYLQDRVWGFIKDQDRGSFESFKRLRVRLYLDFSSDSEGFDGLSDNNQFVPGHGVSKPRRDAQLELGGNSGLFEDLENSPFPHLG